MKQILLLFALALPVRLLGQTSDYTGIYEIAPTGKKAAKKKTATLLVRQTGHQLYIELTNTEGGENVGHTYGNGALLKNISIIIIKNDSLAIAFSKNEAVITVKKVGKEHALPGFENTYDPQGRYKKTSAEMPSFADEPMQEDDKVIMTESMQSDAPPPPAAKTGEENVFTFTEEMPSFPGGQDSLQLFLETNARIPYSKNNDNITRSVFVAFIVQPDGSITKIETMGQPKGGGLDEEAMRLVHIMPKWKPGRQNGKTVPVHFILPIHFEPKK